MKLLYCKECHDVIRLASEKRYCECKNVWGNYKEDGWHAIVSSNAVVLGFDSYSFSRAIREIENNGEVWTFEAFTIEEDCKTVERVEKTVNQDDQYLCGVTFDGDGFMPLYGEIVQYPVCKEWKIDKPLLGKIETLFDNKNLSEHEPMPIPNDFWGVMKEDIEQKDEPAKNDLEQPAPIHDDLPAVWNLVISDMKSRDEFGRSHYGVPLQPHNVRDALKDAYAEALDLCVYLRQAIFERDNPKKEPWKMPGT